MTIRRWATAWGISLTIACSLIYGAPLAQSRELTFDERVAAQKAIEEVRWSHRIWPTENPGSKPPLRAVLSDEAIRAKVEDYLKKSNALKKWWESPVTAEALQAELNRMAENTNDGDTLRELFRVLGDDPFLIAETLGRQTLVDRLIRSRYAADDRFHHALRSKAESALTRCDRVDCMKSLAADYRVVDWKRGVDEAGTSLAADRDQTIRLDRDEWEAQLGKLAATFGAGTGALPVGRLSGLEETPEAFLVTAVLRQQDGDLTTASAVWLKRDFDTWWAEERPNVGVGTQRLSGALTLPAVAQTTCTYDTWTPTRQNIPDPRTLHTAIWTGSEMIVWGGVVGTSRGAMNDGGRYDPSTDTWTVTSTGENVPSVRSYHAAVWTGTRMIVWGGEANGVVMNTGGLYDPATNTWAPTSAGANVPSARERHTAVWTGTQMIVWGGTDGTTTNTGGRYDPSTNSWSETSMGLNVPSARERHTAVWTGAEMIVWGGQGALVGGYLITGGRYNPSTNTWTETSTDTGVPAERSRHTAVWTGTEMIVFGGIGSFGPIGTGGRYQPSTDSWTATPTTSAQFNHTAVWTGTAMAIWGGSRDGEPETNKGALYYPSFNGWLAMSTAGVPTARAGHTAIWTGSRMIVWGGGGAGLNSGGRYDPSSNTWTSTSTSGADTPAGRSGHAAVWTGAEMVVWGGSGASLLNTGSRYDPSTDSWTPTSTGANVPSGGGPKAVWTGTEMIVWPGGRYDPTTNSWNSISTGANAPATRSGHTLVWTGARMIVWGGDTASVRTNTGAQYDPLTDTWSPTSTGAGVPAARTLHTAVWTGTEMIVWGGSGAGSGPPLDSGGRYNPSSDTWTATSTGGVPAARTAHTAVWSGTEMVVWGGRDATLLPFNTGGRYRPSTDGWTATSTGANVSGARYGHTAIWTGTEMIVWGGTAVGSQSFAVNTGGRYDPVVDSWLAMSTGPSARNGHTAVWAGTEMIVWGGVLQKSSGGRYCVCPGSRLWYRDLDGDGYGDGSDSFEACDGSSPAGFVADDSDCDDADASVNPGMSEVCNGRDDNCDLAVDDGGTVMCSDGDVCTDDVCNGVAGCGHSQNTAPCDDQNACTTGDACSNGSCVGGMLLLPDDVGSVSVSKSGATASFDWSAVGGDVAYDMLRGNLGDLPVGSNPSTEGCYDDIAGTSASDPTVPPDGDGYWYVVRAENACGKGSYGSESSHGEPTVPRLSGTCP